MSAPNKKARRANGGLNFEAFSETNNSTVPRAIEPARQRFGAAGSGARRTRAVRTFRRTFRRRDSRRSAFGLCYDRSRDPGRLVGATLPPVARLIEGALS
jgi:hypothetical protein